MRSLKNNVNKIMTTPKEDNCAGIPGDYIAFSLKDASSPTGFADFKLPIIRTFYEYEEPESGQIKYIDHSKVSLFGKNTEYSGVLNPPVPTASPPRYQATTPLSSGRFANDKSSRRLPSIPEATTPASSPLPSGRFANVKSSFSFGGPYVKKNPLSSVPKGGKTRRKRSKRRKTHRR
jgi:hypothetical protein